MGKNPTIIYEGAEYTFGTGKTGEAEIGVHVPGVGTASVPLTQQDLTVLAQKDSETIVRAFGDDWLPGSGCVALPFTNLRD